MTSSRLAGAQGRTFWTSPALEQPSSTETHGACAVAGSLHTRTGFELHALLDVP